MNQRDGREECVWLMRRYGAWLIYNVGDAYEEDTEIEKFDAARSLAVAKRVAREQAEAAGYRPAWRWSMHNGTWILTGRIPERE